MTRPAVRVDKHGPGGSLSVSSDAAGPAAEVDLSDQTGRSLAVSGDDRRRGGGDAHDPDLDDPRIAAARYRALLAELDQARTKVADRVLAGQERRGALARTHRESAEAIRARVDEVWNTVAGPLAHHGISDLDQLRPAPVPAADDPGFDVSATALSGRGGRAHHGRHASGRGPGGEPGRGAGTGQAGSPGVHGAAAGSPDDSAFDPSSALGRAHELCLTAMGQAAELRGITRAGATGSTAIVIGLACLLVAGGVTALRVFLGVQALPPLVGAAVVAAVCVVALTDAGRGDIARSALLGAGTAGVAVVATARVAPLDPPDVIASLTALVLAGRFGLGIGAPRSPRGK